MPFDFGKERPIFVNTADTAVYREVGCVIDMAYQEVLGLIYFVAYPFEERRVFLTERDQVPIVNPTIFIYHKDSGRLGRLEIQGYDANELCILGIDVFPDYMDQENTYIYFANQTENVKAISIFEHLSGEKTIKWVRDIQHPTYVSDPYGVSAITMCILLVVNCHNEGSHKGFVSLVYVTDRGNIRGRIQAKYLDKPRCIASDRKNMLCYVTGSGHFHRKEIAIFQYEGENQAFTLKSRAHVGVVPNGISVDQETSAVMVSGAPNSFEWKHFLKVFTYFPEKKCQSRVVMLNPSENYERAKIVYSEDGAIVSGIGRCIAIPRRQMLLLTSPLCAGMVVVHNVNGLTESSENEQYVKK